MMRVVLTEILAVAGFSSAGMMVTGGMMAETDPGIGIGGNASGVIYGGIATAIVTGIGAILSAWYGYDLKRRESDRLDKTSEEKLNAITATATTAKAELDALKSEFDISKKNWHQERDKLSVQLMESHEMLIKVSNQLAALNHQAKNNAVTIDVTRKELDLPPLPSPSTGVPR